MYLYVKCTFMASVTLCETYLYGKCTFMWKVPLCKMWIYVKCTLMWCEFMWSVPLCQMFYINRFMWSEFIWSDKMSNITDPKDVKNMSIPSKEKLFCRKDSNMSIM